jgi:adenylate cyclase
VFDQIAPRPYRVAALVAACHARLGNTAEAATSAASVLAMKPDFTISRFMTREPFKDPADAAHLAESLGMAGLPA